MIEVMIATAILTFIAGFGLIMTMGFYRSYAFRYETNLVTSILEKARSRAIANINETSHGVHYSTTTHVYTLFEGSSFVEGAGTNEYIPGSKAVTVTWPSDPAFNELSGDCLTCSTPISIELHYEDKSATTTINSEGAILW